VKLFDGFLEILRPDKDVSAGNRGIHAPRIVGPDHGFDPGLVENAFGDLSIRC
jgi:hypothetical protein